MDIVGPFPKAPRNRRWLLVGTNYFTEWVEAELLANIRNVDARGMCGRTLSLDLGFPIPSSQITDFNLIARLSKGTVVNWVS